MAPTACLVHSARGSELFWKCANSARGPDVTALEQGTNSLSASTFLGEQGRTPTLPLASAFRTLVWGDCCLPG